MSINDKIIKELMVEDMSKPKIHRSYPWSEYYPLIPFVPEPFRLEEVIDMKVVKANPYWGTYGMGGVAFAGIEMENDKLIVIAVKCAGDWITINNESIISDGFLLDRKNFRGYTYDDKKFNDVIIGKKLIAAQINKHYLILNFDETILELKENDTRKFSDNDDLKNGGIFVTKIQQIWVR